MKVFLHSDMQDAIEKSGVGRAMMHQQLALDAAGIDYTLEDTGDYDIIHINTIFPQSYLKAKQAKRQGKAVIYHAHSTEEDFRDSFTGANLVAPLFKRWIRRCYNSGDLIITPSTYAKNLLDQYNLTPDIKVVSNGIDLDYWQASADEIATFNNTYRRDINKPLVISVGLPIKRKGIIEFVELARQCPDKEFIWFGHTNPAYLPKDVRAAYETKLPNLTFAGYVERDILRIAYQACDLYLFMTYEETEGIVLLEALASQTNVIVRDIPVFNAPFSHGKNIYKANSLADFKVQMDDLLAGKVPSLTQPGYKIAQSRSIQQVGQQLKSCYQLALNCIQNI